ncbi:NAD(P)H-dependent oxidoreductase [Hephaestia mangrovi]|uniref:NAD(P)H-dependent oxidoreductase n=1 Tax=Hephaestia mangrovi TaxID=2873268 RepID=UPI001CA7B108|nr:NAD(P)H-dependent oxidoreductase [Hephaestia mangrovi]
MIEAPSRPAEASGQTTPPHHLVVLANPEPASFDHGLADAYATTVETCGQRATLRDLNAIGFDPVLKAGERPGDRAVDIAADVRAEIDLLAVSAILVLVYPIWFGGPPAILKGYVDRVLGADYSFRQFREGAGQGHLRGKRLLSITTSGTSIPWLHERGQMLSLREGFDVYLERGFGMRDSQHLSIDNVVPRLSPRYAAEQVERVHEAARQACATLLDESRAGRMAARD